MAESKEWLKVTAMVLGVCVVLGVIAILVIWR